MVEVTEVAARARHHGFGVTVMGTRVTLTKNKETIYKTTSWRLLNDWLDGFECGKEAGK
jgi:hypothetical protein